MDHTAGQSGQLSDLIEIGDAVLPEQFDAMVVLEVSVHGFFAVVGLARNVRGQLAFEIEGDDLSFVRDRAGETVDVPSCGKQMSLLLDLVDVFADGSIADSEEHGQVQLGQECALVEGFIHPSDESFLSEGDRVNPVGNMLDVRFGEKGEHDRLHPSRGNGFAALGELICGYGHPDQLSLVNTMQIVIESRHEEVLVDEGEDVVDDGFGCHLPLVIAVVIQEAIQEHVCQSLVFETPAFLELNLLFGEGFTHGVDLLMPGQEPVFFPHPLLAVWG